MRIFIEFKNAARSDCIILIKVLKRLKKQFLKSQIQQLGMCLFTLPSLSFKALCENLSSLASAVIIPHF